MKTKKLNHLFLLMAALNISAHHGSCDEPGSGETLPAGCTVITLSKGDSVFFGGNDDYNTADSYYWVEPGDSTRYGVIWIGTPDNPQQGVNEKGLAYDANGLPRFDVNPHTERIPVPGGYHRYCMTIMHECATIDEVVEFVNTHQRYPYMHDQLQFADATGDAVILSAGKDGEVVLTRKAPGDGFMVSTNFNVANPSNGFGYPCWRYEKAEEMLGPMIERQGSITATDLTHVMDAVHMENGGSWTIETMVADLVNGVVYIYYFHQYDHPLILHVKSELAHPREPGPLSNLFPEEVRQEAARRYHAAMANHRLNKGIGFAWPAVVVISLILLFILTPANKKGLRFRIPAAIVLGPVAWIAASLPEKEDRTSLFRRALTETTGDLIPLVISCTLAFTILILSMLSGNITPLIQGLIVFGLPFILGWVLHGIFLAPAGGRSSGWFFLHRLPQVLVTTFLGLGGIIPVALPLVNHSLDMTLLMPLSPFPLITWWAMVVLGSLPGGVLIFLFERWSVKRGFQAWTVLSDREEEGRTPGWRKLWWWIMIGIVVLLAGLILAARLAN